jgi:hypothetical protein
MVEKEVRVRQTAELNITGDAKADGQAIGELMMNRLLHIGRVIEDERPGSSAERMVHAAQEMMARCFFVLRAAGMNDAQIVKAYFDAHVSGKETADIVDTLFERELAAKDNAVAVKQ